MSKDQTDQNERTDRTGKMVLRSADGEELELPIDTSFTYSFGPMDWPDDRGPMPSEPMTHEFTVPATYYDGNGNEISAEEAWRRFDELVGNPEICWFCLAPVGEPHHENCQTRRSAVEKSSDVD